MERDLSGKYGQNKTKWKCLANKKPEKKETFPTLTGIARIWIQGGGCSSIVRHSFDHVKNSCGCWEIRMSFEPCANNKCRRVLVQSQQRISEDIKFKLKTWKKHRAKFSFSTIYSSFTMSSSGFSHSFKHQTIWTRLSSSQLASLKLETLNLSCYQKNM